jgi:hypothetical protein
MLMPERGGQGTRDEGFADLSLSHLGTWPKTSVNITIFAIKIKDRQA